MDVLVQKFKSFTGRRNTERERTKKNVDREDFLLSQIDEFREKAKQLQGLLATKANRVQELSDIVAEREDEAKKLSDILEERQDEADRLVSAVAEQINGLVLKVDTRLNELNETFAERLAENAVNCTEQNEEVRAMIQEQNDKLSETVDGLNGQFDMVKNEICEKVHNENVKCYRNMQTLIEESDKKLDAVKEEISQISSVKTMTKAAFIFGIFNLIGVAAVIAAVFHLI